MEPWDLETSRRNKTEPLTKTKSEKKSTIKAKKFDHSKLKRKSSSERTRRYIYPPKKKEHDDIKCSTKN